ncbi:unnamed protein product [Amaranthus hypochondriacus]
MAVAQENQPHEPHINGGRSNQPSISTTMEAKLNKTTKRQRRPSVRLVEIGDQPAAALTKQWKSIDRVSKPCSLTNLDGLEEGNEEEQLGEEGERGDCIRDNVAIGSWKYKGSKPKRESKRPRTNWVSKRNDDKVGRVDGFSWDFELDGSESPLNEKDLQSRANHINMTRFGDHGIDLDGAFDNGGHSARGWGREDENGVRVWLDGLKLGKYWPLFEIHEVDEEVLPLLTLEDLKDMGIHAVGSRRKMYCAIQKLNQEIS